MTNKQAAILSLVVVLFVAGVLGFPLFLSAFNSPATPDELRPKEAAGLASPLPQEATLWPDQETASENLENSLDSGAQEAETDSNKSETEEVAEEPKQPNTPQPEASEPEEGAFGGRGDYESAKDAYSREII
jgi:hypothetical protein